MIIQYYVNYQIKFQIDYYGILEKFNMGLKKWRNGYEHIDM